MIHAANNFLCLLCPQSEHRRGLPRVEIAVSLRSDHGDIPYSNPISSCHLAGNNGMAGSDTTRSLWHRQENKRTVVAHIDDIRDV